MVEGQANNPKPVHDKLSGAINIRASVPIVLDLDRMNYDLWRELLYTHCVGFGVAKHLGPPTDPASSDMEEWERNDNIVKMWIYGTLSPSLLQQSSKRKPNSYALWSYLENLFRSNKDSKIMQFDTEIRNITVGTSTVTKYCNKIQSLVDLLENLEAAVHEKNIVIYIINC